MPLPMPFEEARAVLAAGVFESLLGRVDFSRLVAAHEPEITKMCTEQLQGLSGTPAAATVGGAEALGALAGEFSRDAVTSAPFYALLQDDTVSDVLVNGCDRLYVERAGRLAPVDFRFDSERSVRRVAGWMTARVGRPVSAQRPMVDARLPDGSRINVVVPPLALDGTVISIRRFRRLGLDLDGLAASGSFPGDLLPLLRAMVSARLNLLVAGGTGAGKTTFLNALSEAIGPDERVVTIEDSAELQLRGAHIVRLETRLESPGTEAVSTRMLVRNALRMRPDRILVGEVRGPEAIDMLQAMNTGHEGSMSTVHANTPRDALSRLETMVGMSDVALDERSARGQIARSLDAVIQLRRLADGRRVVERITEVGRLQGDVVTMQDLLVLKTLGADAQGRITGMFEATGVRPGFADRIEQLGVSLPADLWRVRRPL